MYKTLSRYYDRLHASLQDDVAYILRLAGEQGGPVLELGSGTGRLLISLAEAGIQVTGIDNSPEMMQIARTRLAEKSPRVRRAVTLLEENLLDPYPDKIDRPYPLAFLSYNTLLHFREAEIIPLLRNIARVMEPDGRLFIDLANPFLIVAQEYAPEPVFERAFVDGISGERVEQWSQSFLNPGAQTLTVSWQFRKPAQEAHTQHVEVVYHYLYPHQIDLLLQQAGFRLERMTGDYQDAPFTEGSERLLILARRSN